MAKSKGARNFVLFLPIILVILTSVFIFINAATAAENEPPAATAPAHQQVQKKSTSGWKYVAAAISVAFGCLGAGIAVSQVGSAAVGAISEKPELFGRALTFVGLSEGIAIWGLIVAILILYA